MTQIRKEIEKIKYNTERLVVPLNNLVAVLSGSGGSLMSEQTGQDILTAITNLNDTLTQQTNTVLEEIRDENIAQTAILTTANNLLTSINTELSNISSDTTAIETDITNILSELQTININDTVFYSYVETRLNSLQVTLNALNSTNNQNLLDLIGRIDLLNGYILDVQTLLSNINTTLNTNSTVNVAKLEELRVILSNLDSDTDAIESELINIIAEHDQTQVAIANLQTSTSNFLSAIDTKLGLIRNFLDGGPRPAVLFKPTDGASGTIVGVQNVSFTFSGTDDGQINGVEVPDGYSVTFAPNRGKDLIEEVDYQAPQDGFVIISYVANA